MIISTVKLLLSPSNSKWQTFWWSTFEQIIKSRQCWAFDPGAHWVEGISEKQWVDFETTQPAALHVDDDFIFWWYMVVSKLYMLWFCYTCINPTNVAKLFQFDLILMKIYLFDQQSMRRMNIKKVFAQITRYRTNDNYHSQSRTTLARTSGGKSVLLLGALLTSILIFWKFQRSVGLNHTLSTQSQSFTFSSHRHYHFQYCCWLCLNKRRWF